jgi:acetylornithine deacetylase/succinyl-diaminopimelate desuccinylase-like protein
VAEIFPNVAVAPALFVANSDTRWYWDIVPQIYRFSPTELHASQLNMFHGLNERVAIGKHQYQFPINPGNLTHLLMYLV